MAESTAPLDTLVAEIIRELPASSDDEVRHVLSAARSALHRADTASPLEGDGQLGVAAGTGREAGSATLAIAIELAATVTGRTTLTGTLTDAPRPKAVAAEVDRLVVKYGPVALAALGLLMRACESRLAHGPQASVTINVTTVVQQAGATPAAAPPQGAALPPAASTPAAPQDPDPRDPRGPAR